MKGKIKLPKGWELKKLESDLYEVVKKPFKLEIGKDYIHNNEGYLVIDRVGYCGNSGFSRNGRRFDIGLFCSGPKVWREATEEEVVKFFERHLIKRYGEDWKNVKIKECMYYGEGDLINTYAYDCYIKKDIDDIYGWEVWNKNGCLYSKGKWAEVLEEPKYAEKLEDIDRPWYALGDGSVYKCYFTDQDVNHFTTKERAEQVLALIQLIAFRDDIWAKGGYGNYGVRSSFFGLEPQEGSHGIFSFKDKETCECFIEKHRRLLEVYSGIFKK